MDVLGFPEILLKESLRDKISNAMKSSQNQAPLVRTSQQVYTAKKSC